MFFRYCWKALLWATFILVISVLPGREIPEVKIIGIDKLVHVITYGILAWLFITGFIRQQTVPVFRCFACSWSFIICMLYGGALELVQHFFIVDRYGDWTDFIANGIGVVIASSYGAIKYRSL